MVEPEVSVPILPTTRSRWRRKSILYTVAGTLIAVLLLWLMFSQLDVTVDTILQLLLDVPLWGFLSVILLTAAMFAFSAYQWGIVLQATQHTVDGKTPPPPPPFVSLYFYTSLGAVLGTFIPIQISTPMVRSLMLRVQDQTSLVRGGSTSIIEQGIALFIPLVLSVPGILALQGFLTVPAWIATLVVSLLVGDLFIVLLLPRLTRWLVETFDAATSRGFIAQFPPIRYLVPRLKQIIYTELFTVKTLQIMYGLAVIRYIVVMTRIVLIVYLLQLDVSLIYITYIVPTIQLTLLINLTPGNLGLREWTWAGLLVLAGAEASAAANFALATRIFITLAVAGAGLIASILYAITRRIS